MTLTPMTPLAPLTLTPRTPLTLTDAAELTAHSPLPGRVQL